MTTNQIAYWRLKEEERANRANEELKRASIGEDHFRTLTNAELTRERNKQDLELSTTAQEETKRTNLAREKETERHNYVTEGLSEKGLNDQLVLGGLSGISNALKIIKGGFK